MKSHIIRCSRGVISVKRRISAKVQSPVVAGQVERSRSLFLLEMNSALWRAWPQQPPGLQLLYSSQAFDIVSQVLVIFCFWPVELLGEEFRRPPVQRIARRLLASVVRVSESHESSSVRYRWTIETMLDLVVAQEDVFDIVP